jgi:hypothetical protein
MKYIFEHLAQDPSCHDVDAYGSEVSLVTFKLFGQRNIVNPAGRDSAWFPRSIASVQTLQVSIANVTSWRSELVRQEQQRAQECFRELKQTYQGWGKVATVQCDKKDLIVNSLLALNRPTHQVPILTISQSVVNDDDGTRLGNKVKAKCGSAA